MYLSTTVLQPGDPSTNVVLLEDSAAVLGCGVAGAALALTHYTGMLLLFLTRWIYVKTNMYKLCVVF